MSRFTPEPLEQVPRSKRVQTDRAEIAQREPTAVVFTQTHAPKFAVSIARAFVGL